MYPNVNMYKYMSMYIKERDSRLSRIYVTVRSSLFVWIVGSEPKIMVREYFLRFRWSSLPTKILTPSFRCSTETLQNVEVFSSFTTFSFGVTTPMYFPLVLGRLSRGSPVSTLVNSLFYLFYYNLILGFVFSLYVLRYDYVLFINLFMWPLFSV